MEDALTTDDPLYGKLYDVREEARHMGNFIDRDVTDEIAARMSSWTQPEPNYRTGVLAKYAALVSSASEGAITRPNL